MEARRLIRDADHSPEKLAILSDAFDQAWSELEVCWMENIWGMAIAKSFKSLAKRASLRVGSVRGLPEAQRLPLRARR